MESEHEAHSPYSCLLALGFAGLGSSNSLNAEVKIMTQVHVGGGAVEAQAMQLPGMAQAASTFSIDLSKKLTLDMFQGLRNVRTGSLLNIRLGDRQNYTYAVDLLHVSQDTLEVRAHFPGDPHKKVVFGLNAEGVSGFLELPDGSIHALGYVGIAPSSPGTAGDRWMADKLDAHAMQERSTDANEIAPVKGALPIQIDLPLLTGMNAGDQDQHATPRHRRGPGSHGSSGHDT